MAVPVSRPSPASTPGGFERGDAFPGNRIKCSSRAALSSVTSLERSRAREISTARSARGKSGRSAIRSGTSRPRKPVSCASVKAVMSISTFGNGGGSTVITAQLRGDRNW